MLKRWDFDSAIVFLKFIFLPSLDQQPLGFPPEYDFRELSKQEFMHQAFSAIDKNSEVFKRFCSYLGEYLYFNADNFKEGYLPALLIFSLGDDVDDQPMLMDCWRNFLGLPRDQYYQCQSVVELLQNVEKIETESKALDRLNQILTSDFFNSLRQHSKTNLAAAYQVGEILFFAYEKSADAKDLRQAIEFLTLAANQGHEKAILRLVAIGERCNEGLEALEGLSAQERVELGKELKFYIALQYLHGIIPHEKAAIAMYPLEEAQRAAARNAEELSASIEQKVKVKVQQHEQQKDLLRHFTSAQTKKAYLPGGERYQGLPAQLSLEGLEVDPVKMQTYRVAEERSRDLFATLLSMEGAAADTVKMEAYRAWLGLKEGDYPHQTSLVSLVHRLKKEEQQFRANVKRLKACVESKEAAATVTIPELVKQLLESSYLISLRERSEGNTAAAYEIVELFSFLHTHNLAPEAKPRDETIKYLRGAADQGDIYAILQLIEIYQTLEGDKRVQAITQLVFGRHSEILGQHARTNPKIAEAMGKVFHIALELGIELNELIRIEPLKEAIHYAQALSKESKTAVNLAPHQKALKSYYQRRDHDLREEAKLTVGGVANAALTPTAIKANDTLAEMHLLIFQQQAAYESDGSFWQGETHLAYAYEYSIIAGDKEITSAQIRLLDIAETMDENQKIQDSFGLINRTDILSYFYRHYVPKLKIKVLTDPLAARGLARFYQLVQKYGLASKLNLAIDLATEAANYEKMVPPPTLPEHKTDAIGLMLRKLLDSPTIQTLQIEKFLVVLTKSTKQERAVLFRKAISKPLLMALLAYSKDKPYMLKILGEAFYHAIEQQIIVGDILSQSVCEEIASRFNEIKEDQARFVTGFKNFFVKETAAIAARSFPVAGAARDFSANLLGCIWLIKAQIEGNDPESLKKACTLTNEVDSGYYEFSARARYVTIAGLQTDPEQSKTLKLFLGDHFSSWFLPNAAINAGVARAVAKFFRLAEQLKLREREDFKSLFTTLPADLVAAAAEHEATALKLSPKESFDSLQFCSQPLLQELAAVNLASTAIGLPVIIPSAVLLMEEKELSLTTQLANIYASSSSSDAIVVYTQLLQTPFVAKLKARVQQGDAAAADTLADIYYQAYDLGISLSGVDLLSEAIRYSKLAAISGNEKSIHRLTDIYERLIGKNPLVLTGVSPQQKVKLVEDCTFFLGLPAHQEKMFTRSVDDLCASFFPEAIKESTLETFQALALLYTDLQELGNDLEKQKAAAIEEWDGIKFCNNIYRLFWNAR